MDLSLTFLGTAGSVPTARRATACFLVRHGGDRLLFDCGEGAQRQMLRSTGLVDLDEIYLTHYHADHYLGIPGLLKTYDLHDRRRRLRVYGPPGLRDLFASLRRIFGRTKYDVELTELAPGDSVDHDGYRVEAVPVEHRVQGFGYALVEDPRPGRFDPAMATALGVPSGPEFGRLQQGEVVGGKRGDVRPEDVMGDPRPGRKLVISGDTTACETIAAASRGAQLLVHDASFCDEETERAAETGHATARQAAALARAADVGLLALVHISTRYRIADVLAEAREEFEGAEAPRDFDLVEIPLPERGEPKLVLGGAQPRQVEPATSPAEGLPEAGSVGGA